MRLLCLHDRDVIEGLLRRDPEMHLYEIGDLGLARVATDEEARVG